MERLLTDYGDAIRREIRFCLLDQRLRRVVGESDVFQSVATSFAMKLNAGQFQFDSPSELIGLLKVIARTHVAQLSRFWYARRRDLRKHIEINEEGGIEPQAHEPPPESTMERNELLAQVHRHLQDRDRQILDWRQENLTWPEIAQRLNVPSSEALRKQHERALSRVAQQVVAEEACQRPGRSCC